MKHTRHQPGFTLIELILVLIIIGALLAVVAPSLRGLRSSTRLSDTAEQLLSMIHLASNRAATEGRPYRLVIDETEHLCWIEAQTAGGFERPQSSYGKKIELNPQLVIETDSALGSLDLMTLQVNPDGTGEQLQLFVRDQADEALVIYAPSLAEPYRIGKEEDAERYAIGGSDARY
ncbi:MAG: prepilin-type N-terminal cleavage/methylation domain-containing protein [Phycisphaerales bacterium JB063]